MDIKTTVEAPYRNPGTAAIISIIPALGQLYNGQTRKGLLFLAVDALNLLLFSVLIFTAPIVDMLARFGLVNHLKFNTHLKYALLQLHYGSAVSLVLTGCLFAFVALAMRDAYDNALQSHRKSLYAENGWELTEATSGSYLIHFSLLTVGFIIAFFFLVPPPPAKQVTDIQFVQNQPRVQRVVPSVSKSERNSVDGGNRNVSAENTASVSPSHESQPLRHNIAPPVRRVAQAAPQARTNVPTPPTPQNIPPPHLVPVPPRPHLMPTPKVAVQSIAQALPPTTPSLTSSSTGKVTAPPLPAVRPFSSTNQAPMPAAFRTSANNTNPAPLPVSAALSSAHASSVPAPAPVAIPFGSGTSQAPMPVPVGERTASPGNPSLGSLSPSRPSFSQGNAHIAPFISPGHSAANKPNEAPSISGEEVAWGPYMADLQRRIKRAWYPPRGQENRRVIVVFKIHTDGELSNLRLVTCSGFAEADRQALSAVENAAPFRHLPNGASPDVEIQFTFDYNVFGGKNGTREY